MQVLIPDLVFWQNSLHARHAVAFTDQITAIYPVDPDDPATIGTRLPGRMLLPGLTNAHSHAFQRGLRGHVQWAPGTDSFWSWRDRMYALANQLPPDGIGAVSSLAYAEMLRAGFTSVGEFHYLHHQPDGTPYPAALGGPDALSLQIAAAARRVGLRLRLLYVAYARSGHQLPQNPLQRRFLSASPQHVLDAAARLDALGVPAGIAPHSTRAVPLPWLQALAAYPGPIHAHVDEQPAEIAAAQAEYGCHPLEVFHRAGLLSPRFTAVHFTHTSPQEVALLRASGASVCVCPTTELDLGDGLFAAEHLGDLPLCVGTDSHALIDPWAELRSIEWHARARTGQRNVLTPHHTPDALAARLLSIGTLGGAQSLGFNAGTIDIGRLADLIAIDLTDTAMTGARPLPGAIFGSPRVTDAWVGGRHVLREGRVEGEEEIRREALSYLG